MASPIVECVPNFSEGRDTGVIEAIARSISGVTGVSLLNVDPSDDANRTVYTFIGTPDALAQAALASAKTAYGLIDMAKHSGIHPRIGALDVCPLVPVSGIDMAACVALSRQIGEAIAHELGVPVYLYEASAARSERKSLANIRGGQYEALPAKLASAEWAPDFGPAIFVPRWGATAVGAREYLIAYNVNLNTRDKGLADEIAWEIRETGRAARDLSGKPLKDAQGQALRIPGRLKEVRAIGWYAESYRCAQVSINLLNYQITPLHVLFETVKVEAEKLNLQVTGSEIIGLVPIEAILAAGQYYLEKMGGMVKVSESELVETARRAMGLDSITAFDPSTKILEYACQTQSKLAALGLAGLIE
jgi:glutamate formiminotransferase/formiminotetrahydrofolate cyclodeaminase